MEQGARVKSIEALVVRTVRETAGVDASGGDALQEAGVDSLASVELRNALQRKIGAAARLPQTLVFDYPTPAQIATFIASELEDTCSAPAEAVKAIVAAAPSTLMEDGAARRGVVGLACRTPGGCWSAVEMWQWSYGFGAAVVKLWF